MNILKKYKSYQLLERYGKFYVRFWGGRDEDMPCEFPVEDEDVKQVLIDETVIAELISKAKMNILWEADSFYEIGIKEYLIHKLKLSDLRASKAYEKLVLHADIRNEFYQYIMSESYATSPIVVEGYSAEQLISEYPLSVLGAYNYLIYLREDPKNALKDLKNGLPRK